ncbi:MAG: ribonuclease H family protein [Tannerellaceae bacterium]|jgi:ribonuclease HI|nr:ribonuclease H family protein [Tannerellaceae bacterium]
MAKGKFYVVWKGVNPGVYDNWEDCKRQVEGQEGARYKSFASRQEAVDALEKGYAFRPKQTAGAYKTSSSGVKKKAGGSPNTESLAVDAACSGNPGDMEYRGVYVRTGQELFHIGPLKQGTNNVGEFLALVHGLALLKKANSNLPIYTDSMNAMAWVKNKKSKTTLKRTPENECIFDLIERAEKWLRENEYTTSIVKWETSRWGEIPADFGRK